MTSGATRTTLQPGEAAIVAAICFGLWVVWSTQAVLAGFPDDPLDDAGAIETMVLEFVMAAVALVYLASRRFDLASLVPLPSVRGTLEAVGLFVATGIVGSALALPFASKGQPIERMVEASTMSPEIVVLTGIVNGAYEEVFMLGVLVRGLRGYGMPLAIGLPLLIRFVYHLYQGPAGAVWVMAFGLVLSLWYAWRGTLWPPVLAHIAADIVPMAF